MSILTTFFNLIKPAKTDRLKVSDFNNNMDIIDTEMHRPPLTVNGILPDSTTRDIALQTVPLADNLTSDDAQFVQGAFLQRTSGGGAPIANGIASLSTIKGNMVKTGFVPEVINMTVNAVPRVAPPQITATLDVETFEAYVETAGTYTLTYTTTWSADPALYGVEITNTPVSGDNIVIVWDGENDPTMTVNAVERPVPAEITATIDEATFRAYVQASGTVTLSYTSAWSANPALYGITVSNTPVSGDSIVVVYVKENRGTITPANVTTFNSTGWNLFETSEGYARVVRYSDTYGYKIGGAYSLVSFATTPTGTSTAVNVDANGYFNVPSDGFVLVTGSDATTYVYATWSDWTEGYEGEFEDYTDDTVDLSEIMVSFPGGLYAINEVRDEINFNTQKATSNIQRLTYNAENLAAVIASGVLYDTDTNYIYAVRETPVVVAFTLDGSYTVSDHGLEFYTASTTTPPMTETIYGNNLKDKLRTDVLTISAQTLSAAQKTQVQTNIDVPSNSAVVHNTGNETISGQKTFTSNMYVKNGNRPIISLQSSGLASANAAIRGWNAENPTGKYGQVQVDFVEYSPSEDGLSMTNNLEAYKLPPVDVARTGSEAYDILTTKTAPTFVRVPNITSGQVLTITSGNSLRSILFVAGNTSGVKGLVNLATSSTGNPSRVDLCGDTSSLSYVTSTNQFKITFSSAAVCSMMVFNGSVTVSVGST